MKRLLGYLKPHIKSLFFVTLLVLIITAVDLYKPIIIGDAIDEYINGYYYPYIETSAPDKNTVEYKRHYLTKKFDAATKESAFFYQMFLYQDQYYMMERVTSAEAEEIRSADGEALGQFVKRAVLLDRQDLKNLRGYDFKGILQAAGVYLLVLLLGFLCNMAQTLSLQKMGQDIVYEMREELFAHIHTLSLNYFNTTPVGKLVTRVSNDTEAVNEMFSGILVKLFRNSVKILGYAAVMLSINRRLSFLAFLMIPPVFLLTLLFRSLSRKAYRLTRTKLTELNTFLSENIAGMKLIQIFTREKEKFGEFETKSHGLFQAGFREVMIFAVFRPLIYMLSVLALIIILGSGGHLVLEGTVSLGVLFIFINYIGSFFDPIQEMAEQFGTLQSSLASAEKIFAILDEKPEIVKPRRPAKVTIKGKIEFKHVWFAYEKEDYILKDVSFTIEPGQRAAFVGATGAGKTSILNLIGRYFDIQKGEILIDGVNIKEIDTDVLRRSIGQVQQDVFIFTGDIKSNISLNDEQISLEEIKEAAHYCNADSFIDKLPGGYDEPVTERGSTLSAGQRQLLSFARTLCYNPKILVLDEATANIDTETEALITGALDKLMTGRTTIMVAHRLSTIQHADKIMVMQNGRIKESGSHQELLRQDGLYKKLYDLQLA